MTTTNTTTNTENVTINTVDIEQLGKELKKLEKHHKEASENGNAEIDKFLKKIQTTVDVLNSELETGNELGIESMKETVNNGLNTLNEFIKLQYMESLKRESELHEIRAKIANPKAEMDKRDFIRTCIFASEGITGLLKLTKNSKGYYKIGSKCKYYMPSFNELNSLYDHYNEDDDNKNQLIDENIINEIEIFKVKAKVNAITDIDGYLSTNKQALDTITEAGLLLDYTDYIQSAKEWKKNPKVERKPSPFSNSSVKKSMETLLKALSSEFVMKSEYQKMLKALLPKAESKALSNGTISDKVFEQKLWGFITASINNEEISFRI